jgi:hypothetical protein
MASITHTTALWYASRATGVVSLLLLSAVLVITRHEEGRCSGPSRRPFLPIPAHAPLSGKDWR